MRAVDRSYQRYRALVNQRFKIHVIDGGQGEVEQVTGEGRYRGEVAVEEDGVQDCCGGRQLWFPQGTLVRCRTEGKWGYSARVASRTQAWEANAGTEVDLPFTTSFTHARSAKMSRLYSGRRRCSMLASAGPLLVPRHAAFPAGLAQ